MVLFNVVHKTSGLTYYVSLIQWKESNHEVSLVSITSLGFCCVHRNWSHQTSVWSSGMPTKQTHFRSHECISEFFSAKDDCATGFQPA